MAIGRDMICLNKSHTLEKLGGGGFFPAVHFSIRYSASPSCGAQNIQKLSGRDAQEENIRFEGKFSLKTYQCQIISTAVQGSNHHLFIYYPNWTQKRH